LRILSNLQKSKLVFLLIFYNFIAIPCRPSQHVWTWYIRMRRGRVEVLRDATPCSLISGYRRFGWTYSLLKQYVSRNVGNHLNTAHGYEPEGHSPYLHCREYFKTHRAVITWRLLSRSITRIPVPLNVSCRISVICKSLTTDRLSWVTCFVVFLSSARKMLL
jgi:hypothetical protein